MLKQPENANAVSVVNESHTNADKRIAHNALERQRREGLNCKFQQLAQALPGITNARRPSKNMIVAKSLEFVNKAVQRDASYTSIIKRLRKEHVALTKHAQKSISPVRRKRPQYETSGSPTQPGQSAQQRKKPPLRSCKPIPDGCSKINYPSKPVPPSIGSPTSLTLPSHDLKHPQLNTDFLYPVSSTQFGIFQQFAPSPTFNMFPIHQSWPPLEISALQSSGNAPFSTNFYWDQNNELVCKMQGHQM